MLRHRLPVATLYTIFYYLAYFHIVYGQYCLGLIKGRQKPCLLETIVYKIIIIEIIIKGEIL